MRHDAGLIHTQLATLAKTLNNRHCMRNRLSERCISVYASGKHACIHTVCIICEKQAMHVTCSAHAGAPQNHWFGPAGDPRGAGIGTPEAVRLVWSCHREIIHDNGPIPEGTALTQT